MANLDHPVFDCDNHYYEALDAFTRHLDPRLGGRCVQWAEIGGRKYHVIAGRVSQAVTNPTFNPIAKPGAMHEYFRGNPRGKSPIEFLREREPIPAEYRDRDARLAAMDRQGLEAIWLFPTLGVLYEELLKHDTEAVALTFRAFNQWLDEDWGCHYRERIFAAPYIPMCSPEMAIRELDWALARGAHVVCMRPAPAWTAGGPRSPGDAAFDPFWARVNEAGVCVVVHAGDSGYSANGYARDGFGASFDGGGWKPSIKSFNIERAAHDFLITLVFEKLFDRFPNLRIASVENGSDYLADLFKKLRQTQKKTPGYFKEDPVETFRRHVWINPFWEDDVNEIAASMGPERVIFGSDWPHIEGMPQPLDYVAELAAFDPAAKRRILRENTAELNTPRPV
jgi:predicted TIM-barrel fold metal-dependent hydrolase